LKGPAVDHATIDHAPETNAGIPCGDLQDVYDALMRSFEEFKNSNDGRLAAIEKRGGDPLVEQKVARIDAALDAQQRRLDELALRAVRPPLGAEPPCAAGPREHRSSFDAYLRSGEAGGLRLLESKAMSIGSNPDGG
jgi:HK97 family phage major capsid protein